MTARYVRSWFVFSCVLWMSGCFHDWSKAERADTGRDAGVDVVALVDTRADGAAPALDQGRAETTGSAPEVFFEVSVDAALSGSPEVFFEVSPEVAPRDLVDRVDLAGDLVELPRDMGTDRLDTSADAPVLPPDAGPEVALDVQAALPDAPVMGPEVARDVPLSSQGTACLTGSECGSGVCADGVCCDRTCGGCSACKQTMTGNLDGVCAAILSGQDPHATCPDESAIRSCGLDGACNGLGACRYFATGMICSPGTCAAGMLTDPSVCNGAGQCVAGVSRACPNATACAPSGATCGTKFLPGATCTDGTQCQSGNCVDTPAGTGKICCANDCSTCRGCDPTGLSCVFKQSGAPDTTCGAVPGLCQTAVCDAAGACRPAVDGTACGTNLYCKSSVCFEPLLYDDLSAPMPWVDRTAQVWSGVAPMNITVDNGRLVMNDPNSWSGSFVQWSTQLDFRNTAIQAELMSATTRRSYDAVMWGDAHTSIMAGLQRDEGLAYLFVNLADTQVVRLSSPAPTPIGQRQRVLMEIRATGQIRVLVDGMPVIDTIVPSAYFTALPATMPPCLAADAYPNQTFTFDNFWVWRL